VNQTNALWELQPVEVRSRPVPAPWNPGVASIEQNVFTAANVDMPTFQADLANRGLALVVSRNVTARDGNDKQQPYNLRIPGGTNSIANSGKVYDITHLQFLQADYLRGYTNGPNGVAVPGRRVLATPMHDSAPLNYASSKNASPIGGTELMPDGSQATIVPANRAVTWQLTGTNNNDSVVKERYWITFRPGEVRTCANCHGINAGDQLGRPAPTNAPLALKKLLQLWRTNSANAYSLTVNNGSGGGNFGAGSIITLTASNAPSGKIFAGWSGAAVSNATALTTLFVMPTNSVTVAAVFTNLPSPVFSNFQLTLGASSLTLSAQALPNQMWILQSSSNLVTWQDVATNVSTGGGQLQFTNAIGNAPQKFYRIKSP
jgi:mono/diheme cytochrome c family protein